MGLLNPTKTRLSPHFLLSDVMGCSSVYSRGLANVFDKQPGTDVRLTNLRALCENALEPILAEVGPISVTYGFISPEVSRELVTYQDWRKPSHHRADLGAAVDIIPHHFVLQSSAKNATNESGAPIMFALEHLDALPLSRLITYSESPCICVAVSAEEVETGTVRGAWYENRYKGAKGQKPQYLKYPSQAARTRALQNLCECGLDHPWSGHGYPTYHGGGRRQLHHIRASRFTMITDFLYDENFVSQGVRNQPSLDNPMVKQGFELAGKAYDYLIQTSGLPRLSIVSGYTSHLSPGWIEERDWRSGDVSFEIVPPQYMQPEEFTQELFKADCAKGGRMHLLFGNLQLRADEDRVIVTARRSIEW